VRVRSGLWWLARRSGVLCSCRCKGSDPDKAGHRRTAPHRTRSCEAPGSTSCTSPFATGGAFTPVVGTSSQTVGCVGRHSLGRDGGALRLPVGRLEWRRLRAGLLVPPRCFVFRPARPRPGGRSPVVGQVRPGGWVARRVGSGNGFRPLHHGDRARDRAQVVSC
jgi:hypothetical protein